MKSIYLIFSLLCFILLPFSIIAQIGVNTEDPFAYSELDIRNAVVNGDTIPKGILIPRMTESQRDAIDVSSADDANSLIVFNVDDGCYSYYSKTENSWRSLCGTEGQAQFDPVDCSNLRVSGSYIEASELNETNYLTIKLNVKKTGAYVISAVTTNGYYFRTEGVALVIGDFQISVPSFGTPIAAGTDDLSVSGITFADASCKPTVTVQPRIATYSINCDNTSANGEFLKNVALTSSNYLEISVNVSKLGSYNIITEPNNGISFSAMGEFTTLGINFVKLYGVGTPSVNEDFDVKIVTNSPSGLTDCTATIPIILPAMTYASIGAAGSAYTWGTRSVRANVLAASSQMFSKTGLVRMVSFTELWNATDGSAAATNLTNGVGGKFPDVVLYFAYGASNASALAPALAEYIKKGGCVIYGTADYVSNPSPQVADANSILGSVFGSDYANAATSMNLVGTNVDPGRDIYPVANDPRDPIINGPFGNAAGQYWGEDNAGSIVTTKLPPGSVQIASANNNVNKVMDPTISIVWYNNNYNFVYFGDSVGAAVDQGSNTVWYPAYYPNNNPGTKLFGARGLVRYVYDSILELNSVAWCIRKAAVSGINPH